MCRSEGGAAGVPLLVDEAHGAHLGLHPALPPSALQAGADLSVQSTHKQLSALTQGAMLHLAGAAVEAGRVARQRIDRTLQAVQSSSPSYLLLASLDAARAQAAQPEAHERGLAAAAAVRWAVAQLPSLRLLTLDQVVAAEEAQAAAEYGSGNSGISSNSHREGGGGCADGLALDPLRLTLDVRRLGLSGFEVAAALEAQHGVVAELATPACLVLALSIGSTLQHAQDLVAALQQLCSQCASDGGTGMPTSSSSGSAGVAALLPEVRLSPRDAFFASSEAVPAAEAVGRVSAELLCPYPPGVPAAYPGEVLTAAVLQHLRGVQLQGGTITGCSDASLQTLRVIVET